MIQYTISNFIRQSKETYKKIAFEEARSSTIWVLRFALESKPPKIPGQTGRLAAGAGKSNWKFSLSSYVRGIQTEKGEQLSISLLWFS
jgi:hypothetical protein